MSRTIKIIISTILLVSCGRGTIVDETHAFDNGTWNRFEPAEFTANVKNIDNPYMISVTLRYDTTVFTARDLPLIVDFFPDSTELHNLMSRIRLRDKNGVLRGETVGCYCTVSDTIDRRRFFNHPAEYTYRLRQRTSKYDIHGIVSIALKIEKI